jgi:type VI secretion system VgrG family protein
MAISALEQVTAALLQFTSETRLYELRLADDSVGLTVEAFSADEGLQTIGARDIIALSIDAFIQLAPLLGKPATLEISLADGTRGRFSGVISEAAMLGSFGGLTRYRLRLSPWLWRLSQTRNSRVWQDKTAIEIVETVFQDHAPQAVWRWSDETAPFMAAAGTRSYCCQYRESDFDFITRLLTEEGLAWRFEETDDGHIMVLFANSAEQSATPEDATSATGGGIRFHGARAGESADTIQALRAYRSLRASLSTVLSYDYKSKRAVSASVPTNQAVGGLNAPMLESYDTPGQYFFADGGQAHRYALLQMEAHEARRHLWDARSTVRTLRPGTRFTLTQGPLQRLDNADPAYVVLRVISVGVNNLPTLAQQGLEELFGPIPELLEESLPQLPENFAAVIAQASASGYANHFEAIAADTPWRPVVGENGLRHHPKPTAHGSQSAIVVGVDGADSANGADEIYCDKLGRVRIRFHWQQDAAATCWVRVAQRSAGGGMGSQFLPRIGQEVLVQFLENDIDRPIIVGALYNGQGEGGQAPTPGGKSDRDSDASVFQSANDHGVSGQGNLAGGNSPLWHGAAADTACHHNAAAQWGVRSKEFGGAGYNQLLFDDTDNQGRIQLKSSHAASELNLGHLIHAADNYRGSLRGTGAELRTDGYGAVRAGAGLLISSYKITHGADTREPAGDNVAGMALLKQAVTLGETFSGAAKIHETVAYASHLGAAKVNTSLLDDKAAPLKAMLTATSGMLSQESVAAARAEASKKPVGPGDDKLPHSSDAIIAIAAKAGLGVLAGQNLQLANGETITLMSGQDTQFATGGQMRVHSGQAIGMLGGAVKTGENNMGLQLIAAKDSIDVQAQGDVLNVQARDEVNIISANAHVDWAAAKSISLSTAGGANITITGGNITVQCPGKITIHAGKKSFDGPAQTAYPLPVMPSSTMPVLPINFRLLLSDMPGANGRPLPNRPWNIVRLNGDKAEATDDSLWQKVLVSGTSDAKGECVLTGDQKLMLWGEVKQRPGAVWLVSGPNATPLAFTRLAASEADKTERKTLDSHNYAVSQDHVDDEHKKFLRQWVEHDYSDSLNATAKNETKA